MDHYAVLAATGDVVLAVFVHGWHHNAAPGDGNVASFRGLLKGLSVKEQ